MLTIYVKPILNGVVRKNDLAKVLLGRLKYSLARLGEKQIRKATKDAFKGGGKRIRKSVSYTIGKSSVTFHISQIGIYHNYGVRRHKMEYLKKAKRPIPITLENGEVIFRWASKKSMSTRGSWYHPGIKAKAFLEKGTAKTKQEFRKRLIEATSRYLRGAK